MGDCGAAPNGAGECEIMKKRSLIIVVTLAAVLPALRPIATPFVLDGRLGGAAQGAGAGTGSAARTVAVQVANAERKTVPVEVDAIGTVSPIASVALKSRVETTITEVHFEDGARVKAGDLLFVLDSRQIDAQIAQAEGTLAQRSLAARRRRARLQALQRTDRQGRDDPAQRRQRADADGRAARHRAGQRIDAGQSEGPEELHRHPRADLGADQRRQRQGRQLRAPGRCRAACDHQPDRADLCDLRRSAARAAGSARRVQGGRRQCHRRDARRQGERERQGRDDREHRRCRDRHGDRARDDGQRQRNAVARARWCRRS